MTIFDRAARAAHRVAIRPAFGEPINIYARRVSAGPNSRPANDATRPDILDARGAFSVRQVDYSVSDAHDPRSDNRLRTSSRVETVQLILGDLAWQPVDGDRIERVATGEVYTITGPSDVDGSGHATYRLSRAEA